MQNNVQFDQDIVVLNKQVRQHSSVIYKDLISVKAKATSLSGRVRTAISSDVFNTAQKTAIEVDRLMAASKYLVFVKSLYEIKYFRLVNVRDRVLDRLECQDLIGAAREFATYEVNTPEGIFEQLELTLGSPQFHKKQTVDYAFNITNTTASNQMNEMLFAIGWPDLKQNAEIDDSFITLFKLLTDLKYPFTHSSHKTVPSFDCLAMYYKAAFKTHFRGNKKTNQIDKPEKCLDYLLIKFHAQQPFMTGIIQQILDSTETKMIAMHEFIYSCLQVLTEKLQNDLPKLMDQSALLSHLVLELLIFDQRLKDVYLFDGTEKSWKGCAGFILSKEPLRETWLDMEYAEHSLELIMEEKDRLQDPLEELNYDLEQKSTRSAIAVQQLTTSTFELLGYLKPEFGLEYFKKVLEPILILYAQDIFELVNQYDMNFYPISDKDRQKHKDLKVACSVLNSINHLKRCFRDWSNETCLILLSPDDIFLGLVNLYSGMEDKTISLLSRELFLDVKPSFRTYEKKQNWSGTGENVSSELLPALTALGAVSQIFSVLSKATKRDVLVKFCSLLDTHFEDRMLKGQTLSEPSVKQLRHDMKAIYAALKIDLETFPSILG